MYYNITVIHCCCCTAVLCKQLPVSVNAQSTRAGQIREDRKLVAARQPFGSAKGYKGTWFHRVALCRSGYTCANQSIFGSTSICRGGQILALLSYRDRIKRDKQDARVKKEQRRHQQQLALGSACCRDRQRCYCMYVALVMIATRCAASRRQAAQSAAEPPKQLGAGVGPR